MRNNEFIGREKTPHDLVDRGVTIVQLGAILIGLGAGMVTFCFNSFATKENETMRSEYQSREMNDIKDRLKIIDEKLDRLLSK